MENRRFFFLKIVLFGFKITYESYLRGTVDNNLGPDRLAGPKALDPNHARQGQGIPPTHTINVAHLT